MKSSSCWCYCPLSKNQLTLSTARKGKKLNMADWNTNLYPPAPNIYKNRRRIKYSNRVNIPLLLHTCTWSGAITFLWIWLHFSKPLWVKHAPKANFWTDKHSTISIKVFVIKQTIEKNTENIRQGFFKHLHRNIHYYFYV